MSLGTLIKEKRKSLSMTQKELAEGICVQAMISRIENNELTPSKKNLEKIARKLKVSVSYFNDDVIQVDSSNINITELIKRIRGLLSKREYDSINFILKAYKNDIKKVGELREVMFFQWIKATVYEYSTGDSEAALKSLKEITITADEKEISVEIINAIGRLHLIRKEYTEAIEEFEKGLVFSNDKTVDFKVRVKLLFNYSLVLSKTEKYRAMLDLLNEGIRILLKHESLFMLGDFYYQKGILFRRLDEYTEAIHYYNHAYSLFDIQANEKFRNRTQIELNEVNKLKETHRGVIV